MARPLPEIERECVADGIGQWWHEAMACAYRNKRFPVSADVEWGAEFIVIDVHCADGKAPVSLFKPINQPKIF